MRTGGTMAKKNDISTECTTVTSLSSCYIKDNSFRIQSADTGRNNCGLSYEIDKDYISKLKLRLLRG